MYPIYLFIVLQQNSIPLFLMTTETIAHINKIIVTSYKKMNQIDKN
jgi:hypothetical protein